MKSSLLSLAVLLCLAGSASAGLPGSIEVPLDQTIVCSDQVGDKAVSLTGTLVETQPAPNVKIAVTQDHVKFVAGNLTLSVSDAAPNVFAANDFFMSFQVAGTHRAGVPTFFNGQGYVLRQVDTNPLFPVIDTLTVQLVTPEPAEVSVPSFLATLKFAGQDSATEIECQVVQFDLNK